MKHAHLLRDRRKVTMTVHAWERLEELERRLGIHRDVIVDALVRVRLTVDEVAEDVNVVLDEDTRARAGADEG